MVPSENPSVLVLLVVTDGARWLPDVLRGLRAQRYRPLRVIAVDNASSDGSEVMLTKAFGESRVITLERRTGYGRALAAALRSATERKLEADAVLLLHDDCRLEKDAIEGLVAEMRDDIGIVGAKLLDWDRPELLQDIGRTTDRYGRVVARVERDEMDQGQHEGVFEVLYVSSAAMLVSREVIETVGLFDARFVAMRDDLDLCWRARIAGFRTVVTTAAAARHVAAVATDLRASPAKGKTRYLGDRNMIATLIKNYSILHLLIALPVTVGASLINAVLFFASGRRRTAMQVLEALQWNVVHLPSTMRARIRAQRTRKHSDQVVTAMMHHGASRLRSQFEGAVEKVVGDVDAGEDEDLDAPPPTVIGRIRQHPTGALMFFAVLIGLAGARLAFFQEPFAGADIGPFPSSFLAFFRTVGNGWRGAHAAGAGPATPGHLLLGMLSFASFGSGWLAQRILILSLPLVGAFTMARLARAVGLEGGARRLSVTLALVSPLMLSMFGAARLQDLLIVAVAPGLALPLLRVAGVAPRIGWRSTGMGILVTAAVASLSPWALIFVLMVGLVLAVGGLAVPKPVTLALFRRTALIVGGALVLLLPWSVELFREGTPLWSGGVIQGVPVVDLLGLTDGRDTVYPVGLSIVLAAAGIFGWLIAVPERRRAAGALASVGSLSFVIAMLVSRGVPFLAPRPALPLAASVMAAAILSGIGYASARARLSSRQFGVLHVGSALVGIGVLAMFLWGSGWLVAGDRSGWQPADAVLPASIRAEPRRAGPFRIAWLSGDATHVSVSITDASGRTMTDHLERPAGSGMTVATDAAAQIASGSGNAGARALATLGVRYVIVRAEADALLREQVGRDPDLSFFQRFHGAEVFRNQIDLGSAMVVRSPGWRTASAGGLDDTVLAESSVVGIPLEKTGATAYEGIVQGGATIMIAENFQAGWHATVAGRELKPRRSFGWATAFDVPDDVTGAVVVGWAGQRWHRLAMVLQAVLLAAFLFTWSNRAARERGER